MAVLRDRPYSGMNFLVDLGTGDSEGITAGVLEVIFPEARVQTFEYRSGNEKENQPRKVTALTHYSNLVLKRGVIGALDWYEWWNQVRNGATDALRTVRVQLQSEDHTSAVLTWKFLRARPVNHQFSALNAVSGEVLLESLELAFERLEME